jgi:hypothetical protein
MVFLILTDIETQLRKDLSSSVNGKLIEVISTNRGAIFGGFLRDYFAGLPSRDMDIVIYEGFYSKFDLDMKKIGYTTESKILPYQTLIYTKKDAIEVEVLLVEDHPDKVRLGPCPDPDYDINLLTFDEDGLSEWTGSSDVLIILDHIKKGSSTYRT